MNCAANIQRKFHMGKSLTLYEYCCQVPANRLGFVENGGPFNLIQLKVIQECISLEPYSGLLPHHLCRLSGVYG